MKYYIIAGEASGDLHGSNLIKELKKQDAQADIRCWGGDLMQAAGGVVVKHYRDLAFMGFVEVLTNLRTIFRNLDFCKQDILAYQPDALILVDYPGFNLRITKWAHRQRRHTTIASTHLAPQTPAAPPASSAAPQASSASPQQTSSAAGPNSTPALHSPAPISAPQASPTSASGPATSPAGFRIIYYISPQVWAWKENRVKQIRECVDRMLVILPFEKEFYRKWNYEVEYVGHPLVEEIDDYQAPTGAIPGF
ncbi:MAG TPA: hypothetical protein VKQ52_03950, partial [Puia sp.]|nr:hypothetical protein [Puia sp.]